MGLNRAVEKAQRGFLSVAQGCGRLGTGPHTIGEAFVTEQLAPSALQLERQDSTNHRVYARGHTHSLPQTWCEFGRLL